MRVKGPWFPSFEYARPSTSTRQQWIAHSGTRARGRNLRNVAKKETPMSDGLKAHAAGGVPIVGQAYTFTNGTVPVTGQLTCNCRVPGTVLPVVASAPVTCPQCHKTLVAVLPLPPGSQVLILQVAGPEDQKAAS